MATQLFQPSPYVQPYITPPEIDRQRSGLPFGSCTFFGTEALGTAAQNDQIQLEFQLPPNFVYRLRHLAVNTRVNSGNNEWTRGPRFRTYPATNEVTAENATVFNYPLQHSEIVTDPTGSGQNLYYALGLTADSTTGGNIGGGPVSNLYAPQSLLTSIPAGVGSFEPAVQIGAFAVMGGTGSLFFNVVFDMFNIEQRNHALVNSTVGSNY